MLVISFRSRFLLRGKERTVRNRKEGGRESGVDGEKGDKGKEPDLALDLNLSLFNWVIIFYLDRPVFSSVNWA